MGCETGWVGGASQVAGKGKAYGALVVTGDNECNIGLANVTLAWI